MKFRIIVLVLSKLLGVARNEDDPRPDMYLPEKILALGSVLIVAGLALVVAWFLKQNLWMLPVGIACLLLGIAAVLCWRNQKIWVISDEEFTYTTFLGNTYTYRFCDITGLRRNPDSMTLFVGAHKCHMEACAYISDRLADRINWALAALQ